MVARAWNSSAWKLRQDALSSKPGYIGKTLSQKEEEEEQEAEEEKEKKEEREARTVPGTSITAFATHEAFSASLPTVPMASSALQVIISAPK